MITKEYFCILFFLYYSQFLSNVRQFIYPSLFVHVILEIYINKCVHETILPSPRRPLPSPPPSHTRIYVY